jgi:hypothetical protein
VARAISEEYALYEAEMSAPPDGINLSDTRELLSIHDPKARGCAGMRVGRRMKG